MPYNTFRFRQCKTDGSDEPVNFTNYLARKNKEGNFDVSVSPSDECPIEYTPEEVINHLVSGQWRIQYKNTRLKQIYQD